MKRISKHISYKEATNSFTAKRKGVNNEPNYEVLLNMQNIADNVFEKVRANFGVPIKINSFYRSPELNRLIGGSATSQHCKGQAIDLDDTYEGLTNKEIFNYIKDNLSFDQLIWEFGTDNNPNWIHVSYVSESKNRKQILKAVRKNGKVRYEQFS